MDQMSLETLHVLNLEIASKKYRIEKTMQGSVIVWGVPANFVSKVEAEIRETLKTENKFAKATLAANKIPFEASTAIYTVTSDSKGTADTVNMRFRVAYNGPEIPAKLNSKIHKGQALTDWMQSKVSTSVDKVVQLESQVLADQITTSTENVLALSKKKLAKKLKSKLFIANARKDVLKQVGYDKLKAKHGKSAPVEIPNYKVENPYPLSNKAGNGFKKATGAQHPDAIEFPVGNDHKSGMRLIVKSDDLAYMSGKKPT